jgi:S-adenosylmethionine decarboxylase
MNNIFFVMLGLIWACHAEEYLFAGKHFFSSYMGCDETAINNVDELVKAVDEAVKSSGATILDKSQFVFSSNGITIAYLLSESHASIHTYPEHNAIFVDLFTCGDHCSAKRFDEALRAYLKPQKVNTKYFLRSETVEEIAPN